MRKTFTLSFIALLISSLARSQTGYYITHDDYVAGRLIKMEKISSVSSGGGITLRNGKEGKTMKEGKVWGFVVDGMLFRGIEGKDLFAAVVFQNEKVVIYGNGFSYALMLMRGLNEAHYINGYAYYISLDVNSPIVPIFNMGYKCSKYFMEFREENPQFKAFYDCLPEDGKPYTNENFQPCIETLK